MCNNIDSMCDMITITLANSQVQELHERTTHTQQFETILNSSVNNQIESANSCHLMNILRYN